jgi:hypothetical protein
MGKSESSNKRTNTGTSQTKRGSAFDNSDVGFGVGFEQEVGERAACYA